jgi:hypothetical protein
MFRCNCIGAVDVAHPIPPRATAAGALSGAHNHGKAPLQVVRSPMPSEEESNDNTNVDAYLNTAMFST